MPAIKDPVEGPNDVRNQSESQWINCDEYEYM